MASFPEHEGQDRPVDAPPGISQGAGLRRTELQRGKVHGPQQAELPPARIQAFALMRGDGWHHAPEQVRHCQGNLHSGAFILYVRIPRDKILDEEALPQRVRLQTFRGLNAFEDFFKRCGAKHGFFHGYRKRVL